MRIKASICYIVCSRVSWLTGWKKNERKGSGERKTGGREGRSERRRQGGIGEESIYYVKKMSVIT